MCNSLFLTLFSKILVVPGILIGSLFRNRHFQTINLPLWNGTQINKCTVEKSRKELVSKKKLGQLRAQPTCKKTYNKDLKGGQKVNIRTKKEKFLLRVKKIL